MDKKCFVCGTTQNLNLHHCFSGCRRQTSEAYGLVVYLCQAHHTGNRGVHFNAELNARLHEYGQKLFERMHPNLEFIKVMGKNYL
jgi:hypothetical protein